MENRDNQSKSSALSVLFLNETLTYDMYKERFAGLNIYYTNLQHIRITQAPKITLIDLISNLGGTIGIFLGFSIFSLIEVMEIFVQIIFILIFNRNII